MASAGQAGSAARRGARAVAIFGATGMVGQGVLRECLLDPGVERVLLVGRRKSGQQHPKLAELVVPDLFDLPAHAGALSGLDACFYCLGASSLGMAEPDYRRVTKDLTLLAAGLLSRESPGLAFAYVSGAGTDGSEKGRVMWARVKGETENALLRLPFRAVYLFRPGYIQPVHGEVARARWVGLLYRAVGWLYPLWKVLFRGHLTTTESVGRAMLAAVRQGGPSRVLQARDIEALAAGGGGG